MGDELLYREMKDRFGKYFEGHMGADGDPEAPRDLRPRRRGRVACASTIATGKGQRKVRALKRLKVVDAFLQDRQLARSAWCSTPSRSSRRTCARWCSSTVAASRPPTSTTCTAA